ncbi:hypothetical protein HY212_02240 [Candidatus Pacearchaeota archaeon]|nr:hypothetical protein [Candidatus Pacearchaeota archaeon]
MKNKRSIRASSLRVPRKILPSSKRSQIFTVLAILLIILMFVSFEVFSLLHERQAIRARVSSMESFLNSIEANLQRQMYISGFRIIFLAGSEITSKGKYINVNNFFNEAFFNGTVNGQANQSILLGATYNDIINSINSKAQKINVVINLTNSYITISQDDPWNVKFTLVSNFTMEDKSGLARWDKQQSISAYIPVEGFEDPIFTIKSGAKISRKINKTIYEGNYVSGNDFSNLSDHLNKGYYAADSNSSSFLNRLEGKSSADPNGIESFVNTPEFSAQGLTVQDKSVVDHIYFSSSNPPASTVAGMPAWFKIDDNHKSKYQIP